MIIFLIDSYWEINPNPKGVETMDKIKVSLDGKGFRDKPTSETIGKISSRIGKSIVELWGVPGVRSVLRPSKMASEIRITSSSSRCSLWTLITKTQAEESP